MSYLKPTIAGNLHTVDTSALVEVKTAEYTVLESDNGKTFLSALDNMVFNLPPTQNGLRYRFVNTATTGNAKQSISPVAVDAIYGTITLAATVVVMTGADNKDVINTKASQVKGDWIELTADGTTGWIITGNGGIYASE